MQFTGQTRPTATSHMALRMTLQEITQKTLSGIFKWKIVDWVKCRFGKINEQ